MAAAASTPEPSSPPSTPTITTPTQPFETRSLLLCGVPAKGEPQVMRGFIEARLEERTADYTVESVLGPFSSSQFTDKQTDEPCMIVTLSSDRGGSNVTLIGRLVK